MKNKIDWLIIVSDDGVFGGAEHIQLQITEYLVRENNRCMVYFLKNTRYGKWDHLSKKCQLIYSPFSSYFLGYIYLIPFIIKTSLSGQIKRAFSSQTLINAMLGLMKKIGVLGKTKIIVRESTSVFKQIKGLKATRYKMGYVIGYQKIDSIIFQTAIMKSNLLEEVPSLKNKKGLFVLSNPLNIELIQKKSLENFKYQSGKEFIVAAGRLVNVKGFDILIHAFNTLKDDFPKLELWILGEGVLRDELELLSTSLNISDRIKLIGYVDNPYPYFKHAKACVVSSRVEGFPNVLLQMMTCNNKVISTLCAGDIENINGIYKSQTENAEELSKQIFNSLTENTDDNRNKFDAFLKKRTFKKYMDSIMQM
ncbi:N-acetylgalactosamine-N, N'-diacetylbacillosaminyl-diphospho-undecaprenol4-alpha-N-acetylgalactosaminyltransferase [Arenibacter sp. NBRC 103722]|uniref:glycosyltransferase n=1 Tax=Arenibacter sp. NBRC 103722 TaxID=1113929 RepID=UPI000852C8B7|nr:glycosyltransferase [Arenibacter sp. NBRC 103722]GBF20059.1 N-acetylgalactosamine-N, N'-diacetylbacillosaminyl-diphospho-undecaprenol4-alpha-N-acetylgalactosaminyltransferase [Arenibacter sp. NBRC 103722]